MHVLGNKESVTGSFIIGENRALTDGSLAKNRPKAP